MPASTSHSTLLTQNIPMISSTMNATSATSRSVPHLVTSILVFILHSRHNTVHRQRFSTLPTAMQRLWHSVPPRQGPTHSRKDGDRNHCRSSDRKCDGDGFYVVVRSQGADQEGLYSREGA